MTALPRKAIAQLILSEKPSIKAATKEKVWVLNLDQIESGTGKVLKKNSVAISELGPSTYSFIAGTVLYSKLRPYLNKVLVADDDGYATTELVPLRCDPTQVLPTYLAYYLRSPEFLSFANTVVAGAKMPRMVMSEFWRYEIPLPPLSDQRRIAAILDKADALRAKRREAIAKLDQLLQSVFLEMFGDPVTNPKGWPQVRFSELLESIDSGTSPVCLDRSASDNEWAVLKLSAVTLCEYDPSANKALPEGVEPDKSLEVKVGDLLFTRKNTRDLVAACAFVTDTPPRLLLPDLIFRFRLKPLAPVVPRYLQALLAFPGKRKDIQSLAGGSAGSMPNISKAKLSNALIELPPTDLQCEFERRLKHCDLLREKQRFALAKLDATFFALQQQAFAGQL
jgi:type I restriction enzyme S subunit